VNPTDNLRTRRRTAILSGLVLLLCVIVAVWLPLAAVPKRNFFLGNSGLLRARGTNVFLAVPVWTYPLAGVAAAAVSLAGLFFLRTGRLGLGLQVVLFLLLTGTAVGFQWYIVHSADDALMQMSGRYAR
jgi:hypothetical protein